MWFPPELLSNDVVARSFPYWGYCVPFLVFLHARHVGLRRVPGNWNVTNVGPLGWAVYALYAAYGQVLSTLLVAAYVERCRFTVSHAPGDSPFYAVVVPGSQAPSPATPGTAAPSRQGALGDARALLRYGQASKAIALLRPFEHEAQEDGALLGVLGIALAEQGMADEAASVLRRATSLSPASGQLHYNLAVVLDRVGAYADAWAEVHQCGALGYKVPEALTNRLTASLPEPRP